MASPANHRTALRLAMMLLLCLAVAPTLRAREVPSVVVALDRRVITTEDIDLYVAERRIVEAAFDDVPLKSARRLVLATAVRERLLSDWAELQISTPEDSVVQAATTEAITRYAVDAGGELPYAEILAELGFTREQFAAWLKDVTRRRMMADEAVRFFANLPTLPERSGIAEATRVQLAQVLILVPHPDLEADARSRILRVRRDVTAGLDFSAAARLYSQDPYTADTGGSMGWFAPEALGEDIRKAVLKLRNPGDVTPPIRTAQGFHVIKLTDYETPQLREFFDRVQAAEKSQLRLLLEMTDVQLAPGYTLRFEDEHGTVPILNGREAP